MSNPNTHQVLTSTEYLGDDEVTRDEDSYDAFGFTKAGIHKNGTSYDDTGFDVYGFDENGLDENGADQSGNDPDFDWDGYDDQVAARQERDEEARRYPEESTDEND